MTGRKRNAGECLFRRADDGSPFRRIVGAGRSNVSRAAAPWFAIGLLVDGARFGRVDYRGARAEGQDGGAGEEESQDIFHDGLLW